MNSNIANYVLHLTPTMKYAIGHKTPDLDSIGASIACSNFLNRMGRPATPLKSGELNQQTIFALDSFEIKTPTDIKNYAFPQGKREFILLDHNELAHSTKEILPQEVVGIIDHHELTSQSLQAVNTFVNKVGSTCTLIENLYRQSKTLPDLQTARLLIAGIASDTKNFLSSTTTPLDIKSFDRLTGIAKINNQEQFLQKLQAIASDISTKSIKEILDAEAKQYKTKLGEIKVATIQVSNMQGFLDKNARRIIEALENEPRTMLFAVDINGKQSCLLFNQDYKGQLSALLKGDIISSTDSHFILPYLSRKADLIPKL